MSNDFDILKILWRRRERKRRAQKIIEGAPPLTYTAKTAGTLKNYRIYGQTVDGESVGDRTANLFEAELVNYNISANGQISASTDFILSIAPVIAGTTYTISNNLAANAYAFYQQYPKPERYSYNSSRYVFNENSITIVAPIDGYIVVRKVASHLPIMLNAGSTPLPYEPYGYKVPVTVNNGTDTLTTPIYLPEQIKKVGDEAEYIDYGEQKQHRVRKNLLPKITATYSGNGILLISESDGTASVNGIATETVFLRLKNDVSYPFDTILSGCAQGGSREGYYLRAQSTIQILYSDYGNGTLIPANTEVFIEIRIQKGTECNNLKFKPMIRKADITDNTYEPYITNTELGVTLPALPTLSGTNTLSVGTQVQPSKVIVRGKISQE